jgi:hypothetical protein
MRFGAPIGQSRFIRVSVTNIFRTSPWRAGHVCESIAKTSLACLFPDADDFPS